MKHKPMILIALMLIFVLFSGCSHINKFNKKTAMDVREWTKDAEYTWQQYLVIWPDFSGLIDGIDEIVKGWFPPVFMESKELLDELSTYCDSLEDKPRDNPCDFSDWNPTVIVPPDVYYKGFVYEGYLFYYPMFKGELPFPGGDDKKNAKKNQYVTGYSAGIATRLASSIIFKILKDFDWVPQVGKIAKIIPVLAL